MAKSEVGVIADITAALADARVNILTINTENTGETGLVIMTTEDNDAALRALTMSGFRAVIDDVLVIRLKDEPGALAKVAEKFKAAGVNIQSLHILDRHGDYATVALSADDRAMAETLVGQEAIV
jgi:hypothetical protein